MAYDDTLANRLRALLSATPGFGERKMFGGLCITINGHMVCGVRDADLMLRVGPDNHATALAQKHARPMDFTGKPMTGFVYVAAAGLTRRADLERWVSMGVEYARSLPPKKPKKRNAR